MKPSTEIEYLRQVLHLIENPPKKRRWLSALWDISIWIALFCISMAYFSLGTPFHWTHGAIAVTGLLLGAELVRGIYSACQREQWPVLASYLDADKIKERLSALGA